VYKKGRSKNEILWECGNRVHSVDGKVECTCILLWQEQNAHGHKLAVLGILCKSEQLWYLGLGLAVCTCILPIRQQNAHGLEHYISGHFMQIEATLVFRVRVVSLHVHSAHPPAECTRSQTRSEMTSS